MNLVLHLVFMEWAGLNLALKQSLLAFKIGRSDTSKADFLFEDIFVCFLLIKFNNYLYIVFIKPYLKIPNTIQYFIPIWNTPKKHILHQAKISF